MNNDQSGYDAARQTELLSDELVIYTVEEVANILKVSESVVKNHCRSGRIRAIRVGGTKTGVWRITKESLLRFMSPPEAVCVVSGQDVGNQA